MSYQTFSNDEDSVDYRQSNFSQEPTIARSSWRNKLPRLGNVRELTEDWRHTLRVLFAEWWGTMLFVYIGTGAVMSSKPTGSGVMDAPTVLLVSLGFGFGISTMIYATAHISGGHLNPAVTTSIVLTGKMSILKGATYLISQCFGAFIGSLLLHLSIPDDVTSYSQYGATTLANNTPLGDSTVFFVNVTPFGGFVMEFILTFLLVFTVFATASLPGDNKDMGKFAPLSIGFAVLVAHIVGIPYTGPSMNPARSFGPAVVSGVWTHHWVYWVGPIVGGAFAALTYVVGMAASAEEEKARVLAMGITHHR